ncbi:helix-turn-helix domain-containing protein [Mucilaginibacter lacusdianchii]|uniref:helix-turn-helix domain-containing protein n=1 Tax=Mucilaginibacter lacusdianchii TaxID=2684211 RepID=UPI00131D6D28|nr:AraC family transcriptional regulator [Mucilaginibacter sp. JXJ CY 39]
MLSPEEIIPGVIFYAYHAARRTEKVCFWKDHTLILQVTGEMVLQTTTQKRSIASGEILLISKNQVGTLIKIPPPGADYETIVLSLQEDLLCKIALEGKLETDQKYTGPPNVSIPYNEFIQGYFHSVIPYARNAGSEITDELGILKVKECVKLLLLVLPELRNLLFDFSEPHKIDLEKFMLNNFQFNIPIEKFAQLTGRSLAGFKRDFQKTFGLPPRQWLQAKRLDTAKYLIEIKQQKPSAIYLYLGFKSLSHFSYAFKEKFGMSPNELVCLSLPQTS